MGIVVYWLEAEGEDFVPCSEHFSGQQLSEALAAAERQRQRGHAHVCISTELADHVGRAGVTAVEGGKTPDGQAYEWSKAGRAGKMRRGST